MHDPMRRHTLGEGTVRNGRRCRRRPGRPLSESQIALRSPKIGIRREQDRSAALFALAAEPSAAILARMLGGHIQVAVQRRKASGGDWAAYADEISCREKD
ncbi:hypothetical protein [Streptomyces sp. CLV115]|uniref:hypothetical protein n=1 Tax=Streptomyces sp. CLV115 TaxID=3138502 RepID=UPI00313CA42C